MKDIKRFMTNICATNLSDSKTFYTSLLNFKVNFDSDWFVQLTANDGTFELGIIEQKHDTIPKAFQHPPQGLYLTFVVEQVDDIYEMARTKGYVIISPPTDTPYGQRRLLLQDPDGTLVDISAPIEGFEF